MDTTKKILIISSDDNLKNVLRFCFDGWGYEVFLKSSPGDDINDIKKVAPDVIVLDVHSARHSDLEICHSLKNDFMTSLIPVITLINKRHLRSHLLYLKHGVDDYLIKPPDPLDLRIRIEMALRRSQFSFLASPLTGLPGGKIVEEILRERLKKKQKLTFGYCDIDNFKSFNDLYGYLKGDLVIMHTAYILYKVINDYGNNDDFIGHIGGDDFLFITTPDRYQKVCSTIIESFTSIVPFHYSARDREKGFVIASDRTGKTTKMPLMSLSVAVVNKKNPDEFKTMISLNEKIAEIKKYLKKIPGSKYMADRRESENDQSNGPIISELNANKLAYRPLGQILLEQDIITEDNLDEAMNNLTDAVVEKLAGDGIFLGKIVEGKCFKGGARG